ncbi:MAG: MarR family winged helix-turn-helix transcriptional regulator [Thermoanaerobaculia bacterium]
MRLIWALDHGLQSLSKRMQASIGLTGPQRVTLRVLGRLPGLSAGELASILLVHPSTLTGILQRLEARKLVKRTLDAADGRRAHLALTAKGRRLDVPAKGTVESVVGDIIGCFRRDQVHLTSRVLAVLAQELRDQANPVSSP